jgi:hypothetical protein
MHLLNSLACAFVVFLCLVAARRAVVVCSTISVVNFRKWNGFSTLCTRAHVSSNTQTLITLSRYLGASLPQVFVTTVKHALTACVTAFGSSASFSNKRRRVLEPLTMRAFLKWDVHPLVSVAVQQKMHT